MKVLVCGGRGYNNYQFVEECLSGFRISEIICGGAQGADQLAIWYAARHSIPYKICQAQWNVLGNKAGPSRNLSMILNFSPGLIIAFPSGNGTENMIYTGLLFRIPTLTVREVQDSMPHTELESLSKPFSPISLHRQLHSLAQTEDPFAFPSTK